MTAKQKLILGDRNRRYLVNSQDMNCPFAIGSGAFLLCLKFLKFD